MYVLCSTYVWPRRLLHPRAPASQVPPPLPFQSRWDAPHTPGAADRLFFFLFVSYFPSPPPPRFAPPQFAIEQDGTLARGKITPPVVIRNV